MMERLHREWSSMAVGGVERVEEEGRRRRLSFSFPPSSVVTVRQRERERKRCARKMFVRWRRFTRPSRRALSELGYPFKLRKQLETTALHRNAD